MNSWRAGCAETRTSGSEGGLRKRTGRKTGTAPQLDPYVWRDQAEHAAQPLSKGSRIVVLGRSAPAAELDGRGRQRPVDRGGPGRGAGAKPAVGDGDHDQGDEELVS